MVANVGRLNVDLVARTGQFSKGLQGASGSIKRFGASVAGIKSMLLGAFAAAGITTSIYAVKNALMKTADEVDKLAKTSDKLGIMTQELAGLRHAAKLSGVESSALDTALQNMTRRVSEAATGTGEAKDALLELGLSADSLKRMSPTEQLYAIADAMQGIKVQSDKVRIAYDLFGRSGVGMLNALKGGAPGLRAMVEEAAKLGIAIDREGAKKIENMNDQISRASAAWEGMKVVLAEQIAPVVTVLFEDITSGLMNTNQEMIKTGSLTETLISSMQFVADSINVIRKGLILMRTAFSAALYPVIKLAEALHIVEKGTAAAFYDIWKETDAKLFRELSKPREPFSDRVEREMRKAQEALAGFGADASKGVTIDGEEMENAISGLEKQLSLTKEIKANSGGGLAQGNFAQAMGAVGQSGISAAANRMAHRALDYAQQQVDHLAAIRQNTGKAQYAVAAPG